MVLRGEPPRICPPSLLWDARIPPQGRTLARGSAPTAPGGLTHCLPAVASVQTLPVQVLGGKCLAREPPAPAVRPPLGLLLDLRVTRPPTPPHLGGWTLRVSPESHFLGTLCCPPAAGGPWVTSVLSPCFVELASIQGRLRPRGTVRSPELTPKSCCWGHRLEQRHSPCSLLTASSPPSPCGGSGGERLRERWHGYGG